MTALRYNKPMQSALRKAGGIFGLDLAGLFEEDDESQSDFAPGVEFEKTTKGKGGGLYMRPQPVTGETTRLKFLPREAQIQSPSEISINLSAPAIQNLTNQVMQEEEEEIEEIEKVYQGIADGINIHDPSGIYGVGFGPGDLRRALGEGYTSDSIRTYLNTNYKDSPLAEGVARSLGIFSHPGGIVTENEGVVTDLNNMNATRVSMPAYQGIADGVNIFTESIGTDGTNYGVGFGGGDLRRAREAGYSDASIAKFLRESYGNNPVAEPIRRELGL